MAAQLDTRVSRPPAAAAGLQLKSATSSFAQANRLAAFRRERQIKGIEAAGVYKGPLGANFHEGPPRRSVTCTAEPQPRRGASGGLVDVGHGETIGCGDNSRQRAIHRLPPDIEGLGDVGRPHAIRLELAHD